MLLKTARSWIEMIRNTEVFQLHENIMSQSKTDPVREIQFSFPNGYSIKPVLCPTIFSNGPGMLFMTNPKTLGEMDKPDAPDPAAAQTTDHLSMVWTKYNLAPVDYSYDETVGVFPLEGAEITPNVTKDGIDYHSGTFKAWDVLPHCTTGFPAVIVASGLRKWYKNGSLHRKGNNPALRADFVGALWMSDGEKHRANGPAGIAITDYQEFHVDGVFQGYRTKSISYDWNGNTDPTNTHIFHGATNPLSNRFFQDPQDELFFSAA